MPTNLTIANIFVFLSILCLALSASAGLMLYFLYSVPAVAMAGALRHQQLEQQHVKKH